MRTEPGPFSDPNRPGFRDTLPVLAQVLPAKVGERMASTNRSHDLQGFIRAGPHGIQISLGPRPGGQRVALMPLHRNVPHPGAADWQLVTCPECGASCWETPQLHKERLQDPTLKAACSVCALRLGRRRS